MGLEEHDPKWAFWPLAGAWLCRHYRDRIDHGADDSFIRSRVWAPVRAASEFYLAWLVEQPDGSLGTSPSTSPENQFSYHAGLTASSAASSTNDLVAIADLFDLLVLVASRLDREKDPVVRDAIAVRGRIGGGGIGNRGTVKEWSEDFDYPDPHHRHLSHLYFVHPAGWPVSAEMHTALTRSLDGRGDESTGWSLTWKLIMRARLGRAAKVSDLLALIFRDMTIDRGP